MNAPLSLKDYFYEMSQRHAFVYFATGRVPISRSNWWRWTLCAIVRLVSRCEYVHVMVAHNGAVLDRSAVGTRYWAELDLLANHPSVACRFAVPIDHAINLDRLNTPRPVRTLPCLLRWLTAGRFAADDCIATTTTALAQGGVRVPRIDSPKSLWDWLRDQGYTLSLCGPSARGVDRDARRA